MPSTHLIAKVDALTVQAVASSRWLRRPRGGSTLPASSPHRWQSGLLPTGTGVDCPMDLGIQGFCQWLPGCSKAYARTPYPGIVAREPEYPQRLATQGDFQVLSASSYPCLKRLISACPSFVLHIPVSADMRLILSVSVVTRSQRRCSGLPPGLPQPPGHISQPSLNASTFPFS